MVPGPLEHDVKLGQPDNLAAFSCGIQKEKERMQP
jgi:hypothetical protein